MAKGVEEEKVRNSKRRRSAAMPETSAELPETKKIKEERDSIPEDEEEQSNLVNVEMAEKSDDLVLSSRPRIADISDLERRKRLREVLHIILAKLKKKDVYNIVHQRPCSLLYPNYNLTTHLDMSIVASRVNKLCYFNVAQFRQAIQRVCQCQTQFFPANTVRHQFSIKFEQYARKQTTYRALVSLCDQLEIPEEMPRKQLRNMIVGTDLTTENALEEEGKNAAPVAHANGAIATVDVDMADPAGIKQEKSLPIVARTDCDALINGRPMTMADITGKVIGAHDLPKRTRTIEDKAYTINYLSYGNYASFAPAYDSRAATVSLNDSELLFRKRPDETSEWNDHRLANLDDTQITEFLALSQLGDQSAVDMLKEEIVDEDAEPNPHDLETLAEFGIDVSFLEAFTENAPSPPASLPEVLHQLSTILPQLLAQQNERLLAKAPWRGVVGEGEQITADQVQDVLAKALKLTAPGAACSVKAVRK